MFSDDWRKSSLSFANGNCVEVANGIAVRDTVDREGFILQVSPVTWQTFISFLKNVPE